MKKKRSQNKPRKRPLKASSCTTCTSRASTWLLPWICRAWDAKTSTLLSMVTFWISLARSKYNRASSRCAIVPFGCWFGRLGKWKKTRTLSTWFSNEQLVPSSLPLKLASTTSKFARRVNSRDCPSKNLNCCFFFAFRYRSPI